MIENADAKDADFVDIMINSDDDVCKDDNSSWQTFFTENFNEFNSTSDSSAKKCVHNTKQRINTHNKQ